MKASTHLTGVFDSQLRISRSRSPKRALKRANNARRAHIGQRCRNLGYALAAGMRALVANNIDDAGRFFQHIANRARPERVRYAHRSNIESSMTT